MSQSPPRPPVFLDQLIGLGWSPAPGGIEIEAGLIPLRMPSFLDIIDKAPCLLDLVSPGEKRCVSCHRVEQQSFVSFRTGFPKRGSIMKIHFDRLDPDASSGHLRLHSKRNSFIRLYPDYKHIL